MGLPERLTAIMQHYGMNTVELAERLEVQRSTLSHLLSGRNKPSFDFVQRLLHAFPDLSAQWFLNGKGDLIQSAQAPKLDLRFSEREREKPADNTESPVESTHKKDLKMVMCFYTDGSVETFYP